jgi:predicted metal-dependent hydrolase
MKPFEYSFVIKKDGGVVQVIPVEFVRSLSAKVIKITPNLAKQIVKVSYPFFVSRARAVNFLESKKDWVIKQLEKVPEKIKIQDGAVISLLGKNYKISHIPNARRGVWIEEDYIFVSGDIEFLNRRVKDFVKKEVMAYYTKRVRYYAKMLSVEYGKISIKDTTSRWGSCASNGNIAFSWRLAFAPLFVIDYIVAHEVSHLSELNHSYKFWKVVKNIYDGDVDKAQKWLSRNGLSLYAIE